MVIFTNLRLFKIYQAGVQYDQIRFFPIFSEIFLIFVSLFLYAIHLFNKFSSIVPLGQVLHQGHKKSKTDACRQKVYKSKIDFKTPF